MKNSLHRKINKVNRLIFLFGGIFVAISLVVMYYYTSIAHSQKDELKIVIASNIDLVYFPSVDIRLNDTALLMSEKIDIHAFVKKMKYQLPRQKNCISLYLGDTTAVSTHCLDFREGEDNYHIYASIKVFADDTVADIYFIPNE